MFDEFAEPFKRPRAELERPKGSNADEWAVFLSEHFDAGSIGFLAVQIAEAIEENVRRDRDATIATIVHTIGGADNEGNPTSSINYLQRLRQLVDFEARHQNGAVIASKTEGA